MTPFDHEAIGRRADALLRELAAISERPDMIARFYLTPEHRRAMDMVAGWMRAAGMTVSEDETASVRGLLGTGTRRRLVSGSHIDTVVNAGRFDGPLGVVAPILALEELRARGIAPALDIEIVAFGDEEGSRFPSTLAGSTALAGTFDAATLGGRDARGISFGDALTAFGKDPRGIARAALDPATFAGFVEVHIEQGPVLEAEGRPLGIVEAIVGQTRGLVTVSGRAGHAGTVPMGMRRDAYAAAAEMALALEARAARGPDGLVGTVGRVTVGPGLVNVIPDRCVFSIDVRATSDTTRLAAVEGFLADARAIAERRGCTLGFEKTHEIAVAACDPRLKGALAAVMADMGLQARELPSGAGHDAQALAALGPMVMLFVRCRGGVSHHPDEYASPADMGASVEALARLFARLD